MTVDHRVVASGSHEFLRGRWVDARKMDPHAHWYNEAIYPGISCLMSEADPRRELGAFLRVHRERIQPPDTGGRRRTPGPVPCPPALGADPTILRTRA